MKTSHASPEKNNRELIEIQHKKISSVAYLREMINALPFVVMILNDKRQIVFSNDVLGKQFKVDGLSDLLGKRPGDILNCNNSDCESGCGTSENCRICGAVNAILISLMENRKVVEECRITSVRNGEEESHDFEVTAAPFYYDGEKYIIFSLADISGEKRRRMLERIFFHDVLNTAGNVKGLTDLLKTMDDDSKKIEILDLLSKVSNELLEEIQAQKQLVSAENGELQVKKEQVNSLELIETVTSQFSSQKKPYCKIIINGKNDNVNFMSDKSLLSRIIKNMLKNAIEASGKDDEVFMGVNYEDSRIRFSVKNNAYITRDIQGQIFKRSFSTKAIDRGLGTYSMKLLGEKYLKGKVNFETDAEKGTIFYFDHPISF